MAKHLVKLIGVALYYGVAAAAAWWFLNEMRQVNGIGWLQRLGAPFNSIWFAASAGAALGLVIGIVRVYGSRHQQEESEQGGEGGFSEPAGASDDFEPPGMPIFANLRSIERYNRVSHAGLTVGVFDLTTALAADDSSSCQRRTVVLAPAEGLPQFHLAVKRGGHAILDWIGVRGITFDPHAGDCVEDRQAIDRFGRLYRLEAGTLDELAAGKPELFTERDRLVRRVFTLDVLKFLVARPGWYIESHGEYLAFWQGPGFVPGRARAPMIASALEIRERLLQPPHLGKIVPAPVGEDRARQAGRMQGALLGGLIGGVAGFFTSFIVIFSLFIGRAPGGDMGFPVELLLFPVFIASGVFLGSLVGSRLPVRQPILKELPNPQHNKYVGCAVQFGLFGGFLLGGAVGGALVFVVDPGAEQVPLAMALFFGGAGLGLILGPIIAGRTVYCLLRARSPEG